MSVIKFEQVIQQLGEFGSYQKRIYYLLCYVMFVSAFQKMIWVFIAAKPPHRCQLPEDIITDNMTSPTSYNLPDNILSRSIPWNTKEGHWDSCKMYSNVTDNRTTNKDDIIVVKCNRWTFDHSQYETSVVSDFSMVCGHQWLSALTVSLQMGGEFLGAIVLGIVSDRYGRKKVMVVSALMHTAISLTTAFSSSVAMLVICRVVIGFWTPGVVLSAYVIGMEFVGPSKRVFAGIVMQYFFGAGYLLVAVAAFFVREWRPLQVLLSLPAIVIVSYWWLVPESVRWMLTKNKMTEAMKVINEAARVNGKRPCLGVLDTEVHLQDRGSSGTLRDLLRSRNLRKRTLVVVYCWFVNTCVYYGFSYNTSNLAGNDYVNFAMAAAVEFPAYTICMLTLDRFGRRRPLCSAMVVGGIALFANAMMPSGCALLSVTLAMVGKLAITVSFAIIYMFSSEVFPTTVRAASYGLSNTCGRIGSMLASFMLLLREVWPPLPSVLFGMLALTSGLLCLLLPETHRQDLPDTIKECEDAYQEMKVLKKINNNRKLEDNNVQHQSRAGVDGGHATVHRGREDEAVPLSPTS